MINKKIIYHLDDDVDICRIAEAFITKKLGYRYKSFSSVESFLKALKSDSADLCIIDLNLPESTGAGFAVIQAIRKKLTGKMPILVLSRRSTAKDISIAIEVGASDFLAKPIDFVLLEEKLLYLLDGASRNSFPLFKIKKPIEGKLELHLRPLMIDELYIHMQSHFYIKKGTTITIAGKLINELFSETEKELVVHDCRFIEFDSQYSIRLIAKNQDQHYFDSLHRYLVDKS